MIELNSTITCPACSDQSAEIMPTDFCQYFYDCSNCGAQLKPKEGDCCVYCSYGSVPCPPIQEQRAGPQKAHAAEALRMAEECASCSTPRAKDWASDWRTLVTIWGIPAASMLAGGLLEPALRAPIWTIALAWMGIACLANARRCNRTHCRFTGPFYLAMALLVVMLASGLLPPGRYGWHVLGVVTIVGTFLLWWGTERALGRFSRKG